MGVCIEVSFVSKFLLTHWKRIEHAIEITTMIFFLHLLCLSRSHRFRKLGVCSSLVYISFVSGLSNSLQGGICRDQGSHKPFLVCVLMLGFM